MKMIATCAGALIACLLAAAPASALEPAIPAAGWRADVGASLLVSPRYAGSDQSQLRVLPYGEVAYKDLLLATVRGGRARLDVVPMRTGGFYAGLEAAVLFDQDESRARLPAGFGDIGAAAEIGVIGGFEVRAFQVEARVRQAVSGHDGLTAELDAKLRFPVPGTLDNDRPTIVSIGPQLTYGDGDFARRYFGIDAGRAARTGLALYTPDQAVSWGGSVMVIQPLYKRLSLVAIGAVNRLSGDAARSPIVEQKTGLTGILAIAWRFGG